MVKKNVLTPVLAGVLGVTVAGSGVLYLLDNKSADTSDDKNGSGTKDKVGETAFSRVQDKVESTAEKVEQAIKGELDFAYNGKAEITFGPAVTKELDFMPKPVAIEAKTKQKGGLSEAEFSASYDSKTIATLNFIADSKNDKIYIRIPELSSAYLTATQAELEKLLESSQELMDMVPGNMTALSISAAQDPNMDQLMELLEQIDMDALLEDLEQYVDLVTEKIPEAKDSGTIEGDINGNSYSYTVQSVNITGQVIVDMIDAAAEKAKGDKVLKDTFEKLGVGASYDQLISSLSTSIKQSSAQSDLSTTLFTVDIYYDGDDPTGIKFDMPGQASIKMVAINTSDVLGIDLSAVSEGNEVLSLKGAFKNENDVINGDITLSANDTEDDDIAEFKLSVKDLKEQGDMFSGSIKAEIKSDTESVAFTLDSASTADKLDLTFKLLADDQEGITVKLTGEKTDASDISLPSGEAYPIDENGIKSYMSSIDQNKFMDNLRSALGDELYNMMFAEEE